ncbi:MULTISPECIES: dienelactone hydrolase family protein [unclassified Streptomyces]|uniref:dienelactone hydrolase family protein n=1 Tax=unclassified Streptomyces TaxID=2593676 RepID=UPI0035E128B2
MAEVTVFHHAQGLTPGVKAFADELRGRGHRVHTPDLYEGRTFDTLDEGVEYMAEVGSGELLERGVRSVDGSPAEQVYIGFSLGVLPAQKLAQTRPGALGAVLVHSCVPASFFGTWPSRLPVRVHAMEADRLFTEDGDADAARDLVAEVPDGELHLYPGDRHLFADNSLSSYDADATALFLDRTLTFLHDLDAAPDTTGARDA